MDSGNKLLKYNWLRLLTIGTLCLFIVYGIAITFFELKPFWLDEWFIIHNLKNKTAAQLWGPLEMLQQFPRLYLQIVKLVTEPFNFSYTSLHMPSLVVHSIGLVFCYRLSKRLFNQQVRYRFLWILIYASFSTSVHYFVQVKQYTMDMLMALVAIWQLAETLEATNLSRARYTLLCILSLVVPYFSYTYPICYAPVVLIFLLSAPNKKTLLSRGFPILLTLASIAIFYVKDVSQVMSDQGMQNYWKEYLLGDGFRITIFLEKIYKLFANLGSGALFEIIFGILGICGLLLGSYQLFKKDTERSLFRYVVQYSALLVWLMIGLFLIHKLPLGTHRLNAFAVPACGILIAYLLISLGKVKRLTKAVPVFSAILCVAMSIGIFTSCIDQVWGKEALIKRRVYENAKQGLLLAESKKLPIAVTPGIGYPFEEAPRDWALKTHPAYDVRAGLTVYPVKDKEELKKLFKDNPLLKEVVYIEREAHSTINSTNE